MAVQLEYRSYGDAFSDYVWRLARHCRLPYRYERGEYSLECDLGRLFCTSTEWGWYPHSGSKIEYRGYDRVGVELLLAQLEKVERWLV